MTDIQGRWLDTSLMGKPHEDVTAPPLSEKFHADARTMMARYPAGQERSALLPMLYLAQAEQGYVSARAMAEIAELLGMTRAQVGAVATFYTMFKRDPQGRWLVSVCTHPSCALAGGQKIKDRLEEELGIECGQTTPDGTVSLEDVECLCACDGAPVFSVNYENYERMSVDDAVGLVDRLRAGEQPPPGARGDVPEEFGPVNRRLSGVEAPR
ncbi:MAG: NADH-quinone oxidoreductase subunit NuoE family protein [Actinomycetota bacterium]